MAPELENHKFSKLLLVDDPCVQFWNYEKLEKIQVNNACYGLNKRRLNFTILVFNKMQKDGELS